MLAVCPCLSVCEACLVISCALTGTARSETGKCQDVLRGLGGQTPFLLFAEATLWSHTFCVMIFDCVRLTDQRNGKIKRALPWPEKVNVRLVRREKTTPNGSASDRRIIRSLSTDNDYASARWSTDEEHNFSCVLGGTVMAQNGTLWRIRRKNKIPTVTLNV